MSVSNLSSIHLTQEKWEFIEKVFTDFGLGKFRKFITDGKLSYYNDFDDKNYSFENVVLVIQKDKEEKIINVWLTSPRFLSCMLNNGELFIGGSGKLHQSEECKGACFHPDQVKNLKKNGEARVKLSGGCTETTIFIPCSELEVIIKG
ncbi:MAG: hypothetical protein AAGG81_08720 [Chlamydiota bacterium]